MSLDNLTPPPSPDIPLAEDNMDVVSPVSITPSPPLTGMAATADTQQVISRRSVTTNVARTKGASDTSTSTTPVDTNTVGNSQDNKNSSQDKWFTKTYGKYSRYMNSRAMPGHAYVPTVEEHLANMFTHGILVLPSIVGMLWMLKLASNDLQHSIALVYGSSLFILFTVSTVFHMLSYWGRFRTLKNFFHIGDRAVIYIFIAASYTPWLTLKDYDGWGQLMLWVVWIAALMGIFYQYTFHEKYKWLETLLYVVLGVCPSIVCVAMKDSSGMFEMALGGSVYISGIVFFKCDGLIPFAHAIWHCFVTLGAVCHYRAVCTYLLGVHNSATNEFTS